MVLYKNQEVILMSKLLHWNLSTTTSEGNVEVRLDKEPTKWVDESGTTYIVYNVQVFNSQGEQINELFVKASGIKVTTVG